MTVFFSSLPASGEGDSPHPHPLLRTQAEGVQSWARNKLLLQNGDFEATKRSGMTSVLLWAEPIPPSRGPARKWLDGDLKLFVF